MFRRPSAIAADICRTEQPLLRWETFGPVVRAAATAHPQKIPAAVALIGTELAGAAVNFIPSGDGNVSRMTGCNQQQGVLVLSAALRLVAQADICLQGARRRTGEGGLYAQWVRSCFGPQAGDGCAAQEVGQAEVRPAPPGHGQEKWTPEPHADGSRLSGSEVRELRWYCCAQEAFVKPMVYVFVLIEQTAAASRPVNVDIGWWAPRTKTSFFTNIPSLHFF